MKSVKMKVDRYGTIKTEQTDYTNPTKKKTAVWNQSDKHNYGDSTQQKFGQITNDDEHKDRNKLANWIKELSSDDKNKTFLEIGTWNGLGSTKCFVDGFSSRKSSRRKDDYVFYSLECNFDKSEDAKKLYQDYPNVHILNEVINKGKPDDFDDIFPDLNETAKYLYSIDLQNIEQCNLFLDRKDIPSSFDVLLLDGGAWSTYWEFQTLKNKCKYLLLDDSNKYKNLLIAKEIRENQDDWKILEDWTDNNGFIVCKNISEESK